MSTLKQTLQGDLRDAMRSRDEVRRASLRMVLAAVTNAEVAGDVARELTDAEVQDVLRREAKKRKEAAAAFAEADRPDRARQEQAELVVLEAYLPAQLDDEELAAIVRAAIAGSGATGPAGMGAAMRAAQAAVAGRADGGRVAAEVRRGLG
jgi:uncharacterized protein